MTSTLTKKPSLIQHSFVAHKRGERALRCSPFEFNLFTKINKQIVFLTRKLKICQQFQIGSNLLPQKWSCSNAPQE
jgi:hypothetical protein